MPYKCLSCGHIQENNGECFSCKKWDNLMLQLKQAEEDNYKINMDLYADDGCLGCTQQKRQKLFYTLGGISLFLGILFLIFGNSEERVDYGLTFCTGCGVWIVMGYYFPNGCCGEYKQKEQPQKKEEPQQNLLE